MNRRLLTPTAATLAAALIALGALGAPAQATSALGQARQFVPHQLVVKFSGERLGRLVSLPTRIGTGAAASALRRSPAVIYAEPNYTASASLFVPNDDGSLQAAPDPSGSWVTRQWNFLPSSPGPPACQPHPAESTPLEPGAI